MNSSTTEILKKYHSIAVVGISRSEDKDAHRISKYMKSQGYKIIPINPFANEILGEVCYGSLLEMPKAIQSTVEIVNIFRPSKDAFEVVEKVVEMKRSVGRPFVVWMQLGIVNEEAAEIARKEGIKVIMDRCLLVEHKRMLRSN